MQKSAHEDGEEHFDPAGQRLESMQDAEHRSWGDRLDQRSGDMRRNPVHQHRQREGKQVNFKVRPAVNFPRRAQPFKQLEHPDHHEERNDLKVFGLDRRQSVLQRFHWNSSIIPCPQPVHRKPAMQFEVETRAGKPSFASAAVRLISGCARER